MRSDAILQPRYAVDVRVFVATLTAVMAISFMVGLGLGEFPLQLLQSKAFSLHDSSLLNAQTTDQHLPAGQHLLVDMEGVDSAFLNSEERLVAAMTEVVKDTGLNMLSYHCHSIQPSGVSCVGVLLESHISFHTWPSDGVITLDLFTCGPNPLLPAVAVIERLFGVGNNIRTQWSHELRGFRPESEKKNNYLDDTSDLSSWVLSPLEIYSKEQIYSNMTKYQRVDIWDIREATDTPSYEDVLRHNLSAGDPRLRSPELATPDRLLFLDGTIQSMYSMENVYHEALVHPAMFAHAAPKRVAIVGGGEGATLREVLKHKTIEKVTMIELDEELVQLSRRFLPKMSNCSDFVGRAENCFDDPRASVHFADGRQWFMDRYEGETVDVGSELLDVIIIDALDPEDAKLEVADLLYTDKNFLASLINALSDEGVLVVQIGTAATIDDPRADSGIYQRREIMFNLFEANNDVATMLVYEEPHCGFLEPRAFLVVCKSSQCRKRWYARSDLVDYEIYERIVRTHSKVRALTYFDGTTQRSYQWPKRGWETVYCLREPSPFECAYRSLNPKAELHEFDFEDDEKSSFRVEITKNKEVETDSSQVFATTKIPKGSYVMANHLASSLQVTARNLQGLRNNVEIGGGRVAIIEDLLEYFDVYAHESKMEGSEQHFVEVGASCLIRRVKDETEANVGKWMPPHPMGKPPKYSPVYERHRVSFDVFLIATKDIEKGKEVIMHDKMW